MMNIEFNWTYLDFLFFNAIAKVDLWTDADMLIRRLYKAQKQFWSL